MPKKVTRPPTTRKLVLRKKIARKKSNSSAKVPARKGRVISASSRADAKLEKRDALITRYQPYVHGLVGKMIQAMGLPPESHDEFVGAGYLGLVEAAERFDPTSKADFKTFAYLRIRGAVIDYIRQNSQLSGRAYRCARALSAVQEVRETELLSAGDSARGGQAQPRLAEVLDFAARGALMFRLSLGDPEGDTLEMASSHASAEEEIEKFQEKEKIHTLIATLPEKERLIVEDYYLKEKSFVEIANENGGMSKSWVSRLHTRALELLKERLLEE